MFHSFKLLFCPLLKPWLQSYTQFETITGYCWGVDCIVFAAPWNDNTTRLVPIDVFRDFSV